MYGCHTSKPLDTQMAFSLGSQIAVSSRNQVDGCQWKLLIFRDCGVRKKTKTAWSWGVMQWSFNHLFFPQPVSENNPGRMRLQVYIYIYVHIPPIYLFSFRSIYSCQVLLLDMLSEAFHNESVMESSAQMALMYSGWTCEYHSAGHDHKHTPPEPACFCSKQITSKHIMSDGQ